jgi:hypothetical protein
MSDQFLTSLVTVATAIIGVAILAVLVSSKSQTGNVIKAAGTAFSQDLGAALSPISSGSGTGTNLASTIIGAGAGTYTYN